MDPPTIWRISITSRIPRPGESAPFRNREWPSSNHRARVWDPGGTITLSRRPAPRHRGVEFSPRRPARPGGSLDGATPLSTFLFRQETNRQAGSQKRAHRGKLSPEQTPAWRRSVGGPEGPGPPSFKGAGADSSANKALKGPPVSHPSGIGCVPSSHPYRKTLNQSIVATS